MILIINNHTPYISKIEKIVKKSGFQTIIKDQKSLLRDIDKSKIKGIILSGGFPNLDEKINITSLRADILSLLEFDVPIFGICEGHQIIAEMFGGEVEKLKIPIEEFIKIKVLRKSKIFEKMPGEIEMEESHTRYVKTLPSDFELAATSSKDKIEAMFHKEKPIFSTQFHPESGGIVGEKVIKNFLKICKEY